MVKFKWLAVLVLFLALVQPSLADDTAKILGTWKLVSFETEIQATGQKEPVMGRSPTGFVIFTTEGRAFFILAGEGRKPAKTDQERAKLLNSLISYTGMYRLEGDQWITKVDVAWSPEFVGTEQRRFFKVDGDRLNVLTTWGVHPNWPEKGMQRRILMFERVK
ncbi:MAG: lipocalin-like domain-containing protein [Syntrophus sp. (in: bacteria)]